MNSFYCQLDYEHIPYHSPQGTASGNLANNGCGVCSSSMVVENLMGIPFPPEEAAILAKVCGARETYGTNLYIAAPYFAAAFGMKVRDTEDLEEVRRFLADKRGMVIANVRGDREGYTGVFSDSGHYVVIAALEGTTVKVWDPMYRIGSGRYDIPGRCGKVRTVGTDAFADISVFKEDCKNRPFFLFEKSDIPVKRPGIGIVDTAAGDTVPGIDAILRAGGVPVILSRQMLRHPADFIAQLDGLFIPDGSGDEIVEAIRFCREQSKPLIVMGQGFQSFAEAFGISLVKTSEAAEVSSCVATRLEVLLRRSASMPVYHSVELPAELRVCAADAQGNIAALECPEGELCLGVSKRPGSYGEDSDMRGMMTALVTLARLTK